MSLTDVYNQQKEKIEKLQKENEMLRLVVEKLKKSNEGVFKRMDELHDRINCQSDLDDSQKKGLAVNQAFWACHDIGVTQREIEELLKGEK
jgi:predicted nuclease with TOPRIM domain